MKKKYKFIAVFSALAVSVVLMTACANNTNPTSDGTTESSTEISHSQTDDKNNAENSNSDNETDISTEISTEESTDTETETSEQSEASKDNESEEPSEVSEISENSEVSNDTEKSEQPSKPDDEDGYYFDDEQIVDDYHTATEFTDNTEFNKLFLSNRIDKEYQQELQNATSVSKMRTVTSSYAEIWKTEEEKAYKALAELLNDKPEAKSSLEISEQEWKDGLQEVTDGFYADSELNDGGSEGLLSADTAVMNYYKGRTAKLYEQIYELTGEFNM